jgi:hypothetical protein
MRNAGTATAWVVCSICIEGAHGDREAARIPYGAQDRREAHHNAKISDRLVQKLRDLNENWGLGWRRLSAQFELSPNTVKAILKLPPPQHDLRRLPKS